MDLEKIVERIVGLVPDIDGDIEVPRTNRGNQYIPCVGTANETTFVRRLMREWSERFPEELPGIIVENRSEEFPDGALEIHYNLEKL